MGIYSAKAAEMLKESDVEFNPNAAGLLEFAVNSQKADQAMFDTMLEIDFREAYQAKGTIVTEAKEEAEAKDNAVMGIIKKIGAAIEKVIQTIMLAIEKLKQTVLEKTKLDKKILETKLDAAKIKANLTDNDKEKVIVLPKSEEEIKKTKYFEAIDYLSMYYSKKEFSKSTIAAGALEAQKEKISKLCEGVNKEEDLFNSTKLADFSDFDGLTTLVDSGYSKLIDRMIGDFAKDAITNLKTARAKVLKRNFAKDVDRAALNAEFAEINFANSNLTKLVNFGTSMAVKGIANARKAYMNLVTIQKRSEKKAENKEDNKDEKAVNASFTYEDMFLYAFEVATDNIYGEITLG